MVAAVSAKVAFLIGHVHDAKLQIDLEIENRRFGDTIVGNFIDSYENLTLKAVMGYRWLSETCDSLPMLVKMDDDVLVDIPKFITSYREKINPDGLKRRIFCNVWENAKVARTGKWKIEKGLFSNTTYPFPYCSGFFVLVTPDLVKSMYEVGKDIDFFWVDDVFVYGMVPAAIKNVTFVNIGDTVDYIARYRHSYKRCLNKNGWKCKTFGVLTSGIENFKELHAQTKKLYMSNSSLLTNASEAVPAVSSKNPGEKLGKKADPIKAQ
ncbi:beta-1,3-galactosyltransferase 1-like [Aplysia californica]|uniref:Hexosyltransferase n=1 Tax=Aplysia californica TaxID=6500 RepID=A0ABM0JK71_APLCA|nr:beta-1,3-galactosyltransferase 1-like [Aplysia californica]